MTFGEKLHQLRAERKLSQEELARELGVSRQAISRWELGEVVPDTTNVLAVSRLFGVSTDYLLREDCCSDEDTPVVRTAETSLMQRQQEMGAALLLRCGALAAPALYHLNVRSGKEPEMLPFLLVLAAVIGILLLISSLKVQRRAGKIPGQLLRWDALAILCICLLPPFLDWIPGGCGVFLCQLICVVCLVRSANILRDLYHLPMRKKRKK